MTQATILDCLVNDGRIVFVVAKGELGKAIGKEAQKLKEAKKIFGKQVEVVEKSDDVETFVRNIFPSININSIKLTTKTVDEKEKYFVSVLIEPQHRGIAIGREGERIKAANKLLQRYFNAEMKII
jgi:N utilization substance protein A